MSLMQTNRVPVHNTTLKSYTEHQIVNKLPHMTFCSTINDRIVRHLSFTSRNVLAYSATVFFVVGLQCASSLAQTPVQKIQLMPVLSGSVSGHSAAPQQAQAAATQGRSTQGQGAQSQATASGSKNSSQAKPDADTQKILNTIKTLPAAEKRAMFAYYTDLGVDLSPWLQPDGNPITVASTKRRQLARKLRALKFIRRPEDVLRARSQIGLNPENLPSNNASDDDIVNWFHRHAMAAEWDAVKALLVLRAGSEAEAMYAALIQGTNNSASELIPEDVLGLSEAAPAELTDWQVDALAKLLKFSARKTSTRPLIEQFRQGTTWFGSKSKQQRDRTVRLLLAAGLPIEAYEFMPSLEEARSSNDADVLKGHAEYLLARAAESNGTARDRMVETGWSLLGEIALLDGADVELRSQCLSSAVDLLPQVPPGPGVTWLRTIFEHPSLAPAGLQAVALKALKLQDDKVSETVRAQAILTMKAAVDTLLAQENLRVEQLTVPLRMLTIGLITRAEDAIKKESGTNGVSEVSALLLRSMPNEAWRNQIEPSLVGRAYKGFIGVALIADETDFALQLLAQGIERQPAMSTELANSFLDLWVRRMQAKVSKPRNSRNGWFNSFTRGNRPSAPVTRGWQQRNLARLVELLNVLKGIGIDGSKLPGVVNALRACYGPTEAYDRETIEQVLGPVDEIPAAIAAQLAGTMRQELSGDWRSRQAQEDAGFERSDSELRKIVETGYDLATALAQSAVTNCKDEQAAWQYATMKAALSFDRMQFRGEREQDAVAYHGARQLVFQSFADAASRYRKALAEGRVRPDLQIYNVWFSLALGSSDLGALTLDNLMTEGLENADQIDRIRDDILKMAPAQAALHFGEFARGITSGLADSQPEVKPQLIQAAVRLVGDDPAGAPLRRTLKLYNELVQDEIHLHLAIDGSDRVGTKPFGATLTLRHTASIERSSGGFSRYLMDGFSQFSGGQWQRINYQERLQKSVEASFGDSVQLLGIGFFQPLNPPVSIRLNGKTGWQEKPLAYLVLQATDPSVDSLPAVQMDMHFVDSSGPIVLPVLSNTILVDAAAEPAPRPISDLVIEHKLDARDMLEGKDEQKVTLEITANASGIVPELDQLLEHVGTSLAGYQMDEAELVVDPFDVSQMHRAQPEEEKEKKTTGTQFSSQNGQSLPNLDPDSDGIFRLGTLRKWVVTYVPEDSVGSAAPTEFAFPAINQEAISAAIPVQQEESHEATTTAPSVARFTYDDYDLVPVESETFSFSDDRVSPSVWVFGSVAVLLLFAVAYWLSRNQKQHTTREVVSEVIPDTLTPTGAALMLRRINQSQASSWPVSEQTELRADIESIQRQHFAESQNGGNPEDHSRSNLRPTVQRWVERAAKDQAAAKNLG